MILTKYKKYLLLSLPVALTIFMVSFYISSPIQIFNIGAMNSFGVVKFDRPPTTDQSSSVAQPRSDKIDITSPITPGANLGDPNDGCMRNIGSFEIRGIPVGSVRIWHQSVEDDCMTVHSQKTYEISIPGLLINFAFWYAASVLVLLLIVRVRQKSVQAPRRTIQSTSIDYRPPLYSAMLAASVLIPYFTWISTKSQDAAFDSIVMVMVTGGFSVALPLYVLLRLRGRDKSTWQKINFIIAAGLASLCVFMIAAVIFLGILFS